jgi:hypothetical protein
MIRLTSLAALTAALTVGGVFLSRFSLPITLVTRSIPALGGAVAVLMASWTVGQTSIRVCARLFGANPKREISLTDSFLVGVPIYGTLVALIAWTGLSIQIFISVATILLALFAIHPLKRLLRSVVLESGPIAAANRIPMILLPPLIVAAFAALIPVSSGDELIYKLAVPKAWIEWGRMVELPLNSQSYFPASIYAADLGGILFGGGGAARLIHFFLFALALRAIWRLGEEVRTGSGLWAAVVFAWTPAILLIAGWAWVEWGLLGLLFVSWHRFMELVDNADATAGATAALALAGMISTQYSAGPWVAVSLPVVAILLYRQRQWEAWKPVLSCAAILLVFGGFFYLRNLIWTGSPLAPFGLPGSPAIGGFRSDQGGWWELLHGYDVFFSGLTDDSLGMLLPISVLISPLALLIARRRQLPFFFTGLLQSILLFSFAPMARLKLLGLGPLVILGAAVGHEAFWPSSSQRLTNHLIT